MGIERRDFLKKAGAFSAAGFLPAELIAFTDRLKTEGASKMTNFVITNVQVLSMDADIGDFERASVAVENGRIKSVSEDLPDLPDAEVIDGEGAILLPGLIDNHWHLWTSLLRSMSGDTQSQGYFPMTERFGKLYSPEDMKLAAKYAAAEAINGGITCLNDFNHNARTPEHVLASFDALSEAGIRGHVAYGPYRDLDSDTPTDFEGIKKVLEAIRNDKNYEKISLGLGARSVNSKFIEEDWARARELGMRISIHASSNKDQKGQIAKLANIGLLGKDVNIIHGNAITDEEITAVEESGASITMTPFSEMRIGYGFPQVERLMNSKVNLGVGVDTTALSGNADLFSTLKVLMNIGNAQAKNEFAIDSKDVLKMATIDAARVLGIEKETGSVTPGKSADLIMLRKDDLNFSASTQPYHLIVEAAQPANVEFVSVGGRILKRDGKLLHIDSEELVSKAKAALQRMKKQV
ncbi:amidohydrolase family protein [Salegentibacter sp. F188]|uniref:Amidohydrolase family protein n=1 Tax=Autumnicola patrickiae TaxID=3075591 RepID=A0ABU3E2K4_9FLAO|nr:amidohydrolase family protein [Salegentibacter sp. F188]MDT0690133.1 amidohydrolase family protein [Salegentibacter sp. F188]